MSLLQPAHHHRPQHQHQQQQQHPFSSSSPLRRSMQQEQPASNSGLDELASALKKETTLLRDELRVREQMIVATANMLHRANEDLIQLRAQKAKQQAADSEGLTAAVADLQAKLAEKDKTMHDWRQKVKEAIKENRRREQELADENRELQLQIVELQNKSRELLFLKKARDVEKQDKEAQTLMSAAAPSTFVSTSSSLPDRGGQSDAFGVEARLGVAGATDVMSWVAAAENAEKAALAEKLAALPVNATAARAAVREATPARPLTVILTPPSRRTRHTAASTSMVAPVVSPRDPMSPSHENENLLLPLQHGAPQMVGSPTVAQQPHGAEFSHPHAASSAAYALMMSPPPQIPVWADAEAAENAPPVIVSIFYGTADGWSVDTKLRVEPRQTVADLIVIACERINQRYAKHLDAATMCLRTHHIRAQRWVTIKDHRSVYSFAYFLRCASQSEPIKLQLEPLSEAELARRASSARAASLNTNNNSKSATRMLPRDDDHI